MLDGQDGNHVFVHFIDILPDPIMLSNGFGFFLNKVKKSQLTSLSNGKKKHVRGVEGPIMIIAYGAVN